MVENVIGRIWNSPASFLPLYQRWQSQLSLKKRVYARYSPQPEWPLQEPGWLAETEAIYQRALTDDKGTGP
jgi:hypothetical protein